MDVHDSIWKRSKKRLANEAHESREAQETNIGGEQPLDHGALERVAVGVVAGLEADGVNGRLSGAKQPRSFGPT